MSTFATQLRHLTFASDNLTAIQFARIVTLVQEYSARLGFDRVDLLLLTRFEGQDALSFEIKSSEHDCMPYYLRREGKPNGLCPLSILREAPLWINSTIADESKHIYQNDAQLSDEWSGIDPIPTPQGYEPNAIVRTEAIVPVRGSRRTIGVVSFRSRLHISTSSHLRSELMILSDILRTGYSLRNESAQREINTSSALEGFSELAASMRTLFEGQARVFIAFPGECEQDVLEMIRKSLTGNELVNPVYWDQNFSSGSVSEKIISDILTCDIGIAYFSERKEPGDLLYSDNSNVLFEAGIFESCHRMGTVGPIAWIPIREQQSTKFPFDLAGLNTVIIDRDDHGQMRPESVDVFQKRLDTILMNLLS